MGSSILVRQDSVILPATLPVSFRHWERVSSSAWLGSLPRLHLHWIEHDFGREHLNWNGRCMEYEPMTLRGGWPTLEERET
jgi:hypothetical protein